MELFIPNSTILVLNSSYEPINITNWKRAIVLVLKEKAQILSSKVIRLLKYIKIPYSAFREIKPSREMIYKRDRHKCQYCGATKKLTIDHVIPKSRGGDDSWENLVVACSSCNVKKSDKLLSECSMKLTRKPATPLSKVTLSVMYSNVDEWQEYVIG
jgi:5-methylcytosine-specific restriction endonuclease McrA